MRNFMQTFQLSQINQSKHIFFEATPTESNTTIQKFIANTGISSNTFLHLFYIGLVFFAKNGYTIYRRNSLSKEAVSNEFGHFRGRLVGEDNFVLHVPI